MLRFSTRKITGTLTLVALLCVSQAHISGSNRPPLPANHDADGRKPPAAAAAERARTRFLRTPLRFERVTRGDGQKTADFVARGLGYAVYLSGGHATVMLGSSSESGAERISMRLVGSHESSLATGKREFPGRTNQYLGNDRRRWQRGIPSYAEVEYADVYPGVDLVYYGNQRQLEYDFVVAPGAKPSSIRFRVEGAKQVTLDPDGNLIITTHTGQLVHRAPVVYQQKGGVRQPVNGRYSVRKNGEIGFHFGKYDRRLPLVIDPVLTYSTFLGGERQERVNGVTVDTQGSIFIVGETFSADFPAPSGGARSPLGDVFVAKLNSAGDALMYVTYLGGNAHDMGQSVAVDAAGSAYVAGATFSLNFPTVNALQDTHRGHSDGFIAKLDANGGVVYSTLLGGTHEDYANGIAVDGSGRVHVGGHTISADFPLASPLQASLGGEPALRSTDGGETWTGMTTGLDASVVRTFGVDPAQPAVIYAGTESEGVFRSADAGATWTRTSSDLPPLPVQALAVGDGSPGAVYAATEIGLYRTLDAGESWTALPLWGSVTSVAVAPGSPSTVYAALGPNSFPAGVFRSTDGGDTWMATGLGDPVTSLAIGGSLVYAGTVNGMFTSGGDGNWTPANVGLSGEIWSLSVNPADPSIAYAGTSEGLFRTFAAGAEWIPVPELTGAPTAAVAIAPSDPSTVYVVTWFGAAMTSDGGQSWRGMASDRQIGLAVAVHPQVATTVYAGSMRGWDAFIATLSADGSTLEYSTYFGGSSHEQVADIAIDPQGGRYIAGTTHSRDLPVQNAFQPNPGDLMDVFVAKVAGDGSLAYATYLAGWHSDYAARIDVDALGQAHVSGLTLSVNFPVANAFQPQLGGGFSDAFVSVLNPAGNGLVFSTFLGGNGMENDSSQSMGPDIAVSASGDVYVTGTTQSGNFPTTADAFQRVNRGANDAFVTRFDAAGRLAYSTLLGGAGADNPRALAVDTGGAAIVAGWTDSANWPTTDAFQPVYAGFEDGFVARIEEGTLPADSAPPATMMTLSGTQGLVGWYRSAVQVTLSANDGADGSGVHLIQYRVNNGPLETYTRPFTISQEGSTFVLAQATDNAGNVETPRPAAHIRVDTLAPAVNITAPEARDYLHSDTLTAAFSVTDSGSGVSGAASATLDGSVWTGNSVALLTLPLGPHTLAVSAVDVAGNPSQASVTFHIVATVDSMIASVNAFAGQMESSAYNNLTAKLTDASEALRRGNVNAARNKLEEVLNYCTRESGRAMTAGAASSLSADAAYVLGTL